MPECKQTDTIYVETIEVKDRQIFWRICHCNVCKHVFEIKPHYATAVRCGNCNLPLMNISAFHDIEIDVAAKCVKCPDSQAKQPNA